MATTAFVIGQGVLQGFIYIFIFMIVLIIITALLVFSSPLVRNVWYSMNN